MYRHQSPWVAAGVGLVLPVALLSPGCTDSSSRRGSSAGSQVSGSASSVRLSPSRIDTTAPPASGSLSELVQLSVGGDASVSWVFTSSTSWLRVITGAGAGDATLELSVSPSSLSPGVHDGSAEVTTSNGLSATLPVRVTITAAATGDQVALSASALVFQASTTGVQPPTKSVDLSTASTTNWSASSSAPWANLVPAQGSGSQRVSVAVDAQGLSVY